MIEHRLVTGRWVRVEPCVYAIAGFPRSWQQRVLIACLDAAPFGAASHVTAGVIWSIVDRKQPMVEVLVPYGKDARAGGAIVHRTRAAFEVVRMRSVPVTSPARTIVDLAARLPTAELEEALDIALRRSLVVTDDVLAELELRRRIRGAARLRVLLSERAGRSRHAESRFETRVVRILADAGLPSPELQHEIRRDGHLVGRVDLCYPRERVFIELDGWEFHAGRQAFDRAHIRQNLIVELGWVPLGFTWRDLRRPRYVAGTVRNVLRQRGNRDV